MPKSKLKATVSREYKKMVRRFLDILDSLELHAKEWRLFFLIAELAQSAVIGKAGLRFAAQTIREHIGTRADGPLLSPVRSEILGEALKHKLFDHEHWLLLDELVADALTATKKKRERLVLKEIKKVTNKELLDSNVFDQPIPFHRSIKSHQDDELEFT